MPPLSAHLTETGGHGRLRFHPDCPVCRQERLLGAPAAGSLTSQRTQAALAAAVLALSAATPGVSAAVEPDQQQEGDAAPGAGPDERPEFDPGGDTQLPFEVGPPAPGLPDGDGSDDEGDGEPVEAEPVSDPDAQLVPAEEPEQPAPLGEEPPTPPAQPQPTPTAPPAEPPAAPEKEPQSIEPNRSLSQTDRSERTRKTRARERPPHRTAAPQPPLDSGGPPAAVPQPTPASSPAPLAQAGNAPAIAHSSADEPDAPSPGDRLYVVRPGDSLWSIAKDLLPPGAAAARVAREVNRLWELNRDRIGTGDPDLLMAGTRLRLR